MILDEQGTQWLFVAEVMLVYVLVGCFISWQSRRLDVHESGAMNAILLFFFQTIALLAQDANGADSGLAGVFELLNLDPSFISEDARCWGALSRS